MPLCRLEKSTYVLSTGLEKNAEHLWRLGSTEAFRFFWHPGSLWIAVNLWYSAAISYFGTMLVNMAISSIPQKGRRYALMYLITSLLPSIDQLESNSQPGLES